MRRRVRHVRKRELWTLVRAYAEARIDEHLKSTEKTVAARRRRAEKLDEAFDAVCAPKGGENG